MNRLMLVALGAVSLSAAAPDQQPTTFSGIITDSVCARGGHAGMRMGPTDGDCTIACVKAHDAFYVLDVGKDAYTLSDQKSPEEFAGRKVSVIGSLDARTRTIRVESISAAD